jgi:hypothetical protein
MSNLTKKNKIKPSDEIVINFISDIIVYFYFKMKNNLKKTKQEKRKENNV